VPLTRELYRTWDEGPIAWGGRPVVVDQDARRPVDRIPDFLALLEGLGRPADVLVLTQAEWQARRGRAFHREVTTRGLRLDRDERG
jgi:hypothetical protein